MVTSTKIDTEITEILEITIKQMSEDSKNNGKVKKLFKFLKERLLFGTPRGSSLSSLVTEMSSKDPLKENFPRQNDDFIFVWNCLC